MDPLLLRGLHTNSLISIEKTCNESPETDDMIADDEGGVVNFNNKFTCLESVINFVLEDTVDVECRVQSN